jgi:hypothetical protein
MEIFENLNIMKVENLSRAIELKEHLEILDKSYKLLNNSMELMITTVGCDVIVSTLYLPNLNDKIRPIIKEELTNKSKELIDEIEKL